MKSRRTVFKSALILISAVLLAGTSMAENCLWKVSNKTGSLYLQGSIHVLTEAAYPLAPAILNAYAESSVLVLEVDMKDMEAPGTQQLIMSKAMLPSGESLQKSLTPKVYSALIEAFSKSNIPEAAMQQFKPWFCGLTLSLVRMQSLGFNPALGLDKYFHTRAVADGKKVIGLETVEFQINLLNSLSEANQDDFIKRTLKDLNLLEENVDKLVAAWTSGKIDKLGKLMLESFKEFPSFYDDFVVARNKQWVKQFDAMTRSPETHMVVVGAGHLPGKGGLLELLKARGFKIEQL